MNTRVIVCNNWIRSDLSTIRNFIHILVTENEMAFMRYESEMYASK